MDKRLRELERQALFDLDAKEHLARHRERICGHDELQWLCTTAFQQRVYTMSQCKNCDKVINAVFNEKTREWDFVK